LGEKEIRKRKR